MKLRDYIIIIENDNIEEIKKFLENTLEPICDVWLPYHINRFDGCAVGYLDDEECWDWDGDYFLNMKKK